MRAKKLLFIMIMASLVILLAGIGFDKYDEQKTIDNYREMLCGILGVDIIQSSYDWDDETDDAGYYTYEDNGYYYGVNKNTGRLTEIIAKSENDAAAASKTGELSPLAQGLELFRKVEGSDITGILDTETYDNGAFFTVEINEKLGGIPTGAKGYIAYYNNGSLLGANFYYKNKSMPDGGDILTEQAAYDIAVEEIYNRSQQLSSFELIDDGKYEACITTLNGETFWQINMNADLSYNEGSSKVVHFSVNVEAVTGEVLVIATNYGDQY